MPNRALFSVLDSILDPIVTLDTQGQVAAINPAASSLLGYPPEQLVGKDIGEVLGAFSGRRLITALERRRVSSGSGVVSHQIEARRADGATFPAEVTVSESRSGGGPLYLCTVRDISERRREQGLEDLLHAIDSLVLHGRPLNDILAFICRQTVELFGFALVWIGLKESDGTVSVRAYHGEGGHYLDNLKIRWEGDEGPSCPAGLAVASGRVQALRSEGEGYAEWRERARTFGIRAFVSLPLRAQEEVLGVLNLCARRTEILDEEAVLLLQDLADRITVTLQLVQDQEKLRLQGVALASAANAVIITGRDGVIEWVNDAFTRLSGYPAGEAIGRTPRLLSSHAQPSDIFQDLWSTILAGRPWRGELINRHKEGHLYQVEQTITPLRNAQGAVTHFVAIHEDITERKRVERELEAARDAALDSARIKSEFLANISHEIRTPMNGVLGMLSLLRQTELSTEQREFAETAHRSGDILLTLLNNILDYSKMEAGRLDLENIEFDPRRAVEDVTELYAAPAYGKGIELSCLVDPAVPERLRGDPTRLRQVLANLIGNAVKFTGQGAVDVRVERAVREGDLVQLRFEVADSGIGIAPEYHQSIFEIFSQADGSTTRKYGGSGLGLAICKELAERMGGEIGVESEPGRGSRFWFTARFQVEREVAPGDELAGVRVLIVGDSETNRVILAHHLAAYGAEPRAAVDLAAARAALAEAPCELVILAVSLPGAVELARELDAAGGPPLLLLAPFGHNGVPRALEARSAGVIRKPVMQSRLHERVAIALGLAEEAAPVAVEAVAAALDERRILVAEDNPVNQKVTLGMLRRLGFEAEVVDNGREAVEAQAREQFDLIFMDVQMPELDGYQATELIRELEGGRRHTPIVALTASTSRGDAQCLEAGMDDYLLKPVKIEALQRALKRWLGGGEAAVVPPSPEEIGKGTEAVAAAAPAGAAIDAERLAQLREIMEESFDEMVSSYTHDTPQRLAEMGEALAAGEAERLLRLAHALKGASTNIGAETLAGLCKELEECGRNGRMEGATGRLAAAEAEYRRVEAVLRG